MLKILLNELAQILKKRIELKLRDLNFHVNESYEQKYIQN